MYKDTTSGEQSSQVSSASLEAETLSTEGKPRSLLYLPWSRDEWEWWSRVAIILAVLAALAFGVYVSGLGDASIYAYYALPFIRIFAIGGAFFGLIRSLFRPPVVRPSRVIAFVLLVLAALPGSRTWFEAPVTTEAWTAPVAFQLPFKKAPSNLNWTVLAGGDELSTNTLAGNFATRWAYVFTLTDSKNRPDPSGGESNELHDYYCYGKPVLAPADGEVVEVVDQHQDQKPGERNTASVLGNYVVLRVAPEAYLYLSFLKEGSVALKEGQQVEAGDVVGACGNSGFSGTPQLLVHLQNRLSYPIAEGLPLRFSDYKVKGKRVQRGMPKGAVNPEQYDGDQVDP